MNINLKLSLVAAAASVLALTACADTGMTSGAGVASAVAVMPESEMPTDMRGFVTMAASSDMLEIQSSQLAKSRGVNVDMMAFADHVIRDHTATTAAMASMLAGMNPPMMPPTSMTAKHQAALETLQAAGTGDSFARAYAQAQVMSHQEAVNLYSAYSKRGDNSMLKRFATATLPSLKGHLAHAQRLNAGGMS